jgi:hypothetical protein
VDAAKRRTRFQERVRVERDFLVPVNSHFRDAAHLTGMTEAAIASWEMRVSALIGLEATVSLSQVLREASARAELLADNSRDVFLAERRVGSDGLSALKTLLVERLRKLGSASIP